MFFRTTLRSLAILVLLWAGANWWTTSGASANVLNTSDDLLSKVEPQVLEAIRANGTTDFMVQFAGQADLSGVQGMDWQERGEWVYQTLLETAARSQGKAIAELERRGVKYYSSFGGNRLFVWSADLDTLSWLAALPEVVSVNAPRTYAISQFVQQDVIAFPIGALNILAAGFQYTVRETGPQEMSWGVIDTKADQFWSTFGLQGEGVVVAGIDTGVQYDHPALDQAYKCQANPGDPACWYDPGNICGGTPCDNNGHGTATMGIIVADDDPSLPYQVGMAPGGQWIACKGCSSSSCSDVDLIACADWALAPGSNPANRPHVVNNAWGGQGCNGWFKPYINAWTAAGIVATFAPGGGGPQCNTLGSPADYQEVFTSVAYDSSRMIASFSPRGPSCEGHDPFTKPNISAPGVSIVAPIPNNNWTTYSGTSFSNSYGSGGMMLLLSCNPGLIGYPGELMAALQNAADTPPDGNCGAPPDGEGNYTYGYGYMNLLEAGFQNCGDPGVLEGQVTDATNGAPLQGASVTAEPALNHILSITDPNGYYSMTLVEGDYLVTAALGGYLSQTVTATVVASETTILDFALEIIPPEIDVIPATISVTLPGGEISIEPITVTNLGGSALTFTVDNPDGVTWLSFVPQDGELDPAASQVVSVTLDTIDLGGGVYTTTLEFASNDPNTPLVVVPVTLTVIPVGQLEGHVTDSVTGDPLAGASVTVEPAGNHILAITDPSGYYSMTLLAGDYQVTTELEYYFSQIQPATVVGNETTVLDFAMEIIPPEIDVTPSVISVTLPTGESSIEAVTVANLGGSPLSFTVSNPEAVSWLSFTPQGGELDPDASQVVSVTLDASELSAGVYTATLELASDDPETPLVVLPVTLTVLPACIPVSEADFSWTPEAPLAWEIITFTAMVTGSGPIDFVWDFGDGVTATGEVVLHSFTSGVYNVTLTASNACGVDEISYTITVASTVWWVNLPLVSKN